MLSKNTIKLIGSLAQKKYRKKEGLFVAEGPKIIEDLSKSMRCVLLLYVRSYSEWASALDIRKEGMVCVSDEEMSRVSYMTTPQGVLALFEIPSWEFDARLPERELCLGLDGIQDPGNLGTIVRLADWFGINDIFCSRETADVFSPKAIQATMGAISRVRLHYVSLTDMIAGLTDVPVYGTLLDGEDMYSKALSPHGIIVMGNEGNGLTREVREMVTQRLFIPPYPRGVETSESLNVAMATAIVLSEFRRRC